MQKAIQILDEMIEEINIGNVSYVEQPITILQEAKSRIQALGDGESLEEIIENINIPIAITNCGEHNGGSKWEIRTTPYAKGEGTTLKEAILSLKGKLSPK